MMMDKFCKFCGTEHVAAQYPKECGHCGNITWINPTPVAVLLQTVEDCEGMVGVLLGRRGIDPHKGKWALIGGYIDCGDADIISAARREFWEEGGYGNFRAVSAEHMRLASSYSDGQFLLTFVETTKPLHLNDLRHFIPNNECLEIRIAWRPEPLAFESHTNALADFYSRGLRTR